MEFSMVCNRLSWEEKSIVEAAKNKNIKVDIILNTTYFVDLEKDNVSNDIVLQRSLSYVRGLYITAILENFGHTVINSYKTSEICGNKLLTTIKLLKAGIPTPKTYCAFTKDSALQALEELDYPVVIKPVIGSWGRLIALLKDQDFAKAILEEREIMGNIFQKVYYLQKYVEKPPRNRDQYVRGDKVPRDIRVFLIGDEVVAAMNRHEMQGDWRSTATRGARAISCEITSEMVELANKAAKVVEGEILGIDLIEGEQLMVQEINHVSGFHALAHSTGKNIGGRIVDYLIEKMKR
ncbi:MAG: RimK family alpha-L-glutamate ligase [Candidatus Helarchaeota archaeon]|nr:RimK family alpha-L-glutamate ligase [Candidatus Helarchaeota archaeon]